SQIAGRQHQTLQQLYKGLTVEGGSVSLQTAGQATVSVFGTLYSDISLDTTPGISALDAGRIVETAARAEIAFGARPSLVVLPSPSGTVALTYKATVARGVTYYVDAHTGEILLVADEKNHEVGAGTGALGDTKKISTALISGAYRTRDTLRPATISTFDTGGSELVLDRMETGTSVLHTQRHDVSLQQHCLRRRSWCPASAVLQRWAIRGRRGADGRPQRRTVRHLRRQRRVLLPAARVGPAESRLSDGRGHPRFKRSVVE
ncbi:MAG TPA: hypothetical protein VMZ66_09040, partial [Aeromicrobium sp.]|nr:hypothetical protein [Aeromicrobium sp.]